jgi:hypothetical protein
MSNKRITDLTELTNPTTDDVFPVVDIATNTTTKVQLGNLPVPSSVTTALATKQDSLVSGTNIKTINSTSVLGSGNIAVQETLVSGTNIKTLNDTSLLGSGNIVLTANPSGVAGAIQFSDGSAFASDAANLFWDDTNNRLGIGTNAASAKIHIKGSGTTGASTSLLVQNSDGVQLFRIDDDRDVFFGSSTSNYIHQGIFFQGDYYGAGNWNFGTTSNLGARLGIKGSGSTSATTSLLVQNSAGTELFKVNDNGSVSIGQTNSIVTLVQGYNNTFSENRLSFYQASTNIRGINAGGQGLIVSKNTGVSDLYPSSIFAIDSTTQGFLPPRMTTTQKNAIATPAAGLVVYDSTTNKLQCYNGSTWNDLF